jgi:hypothetical protein
MWTRRYWQIVLIALPVLLLVAGVAGRTVSGPAPARPDFPWPGHRFVAEYAGVRSSIAHNLYYRGLFDFGRTIRASDVFLTGSSHMQLGISARRIAQATGNKVFNLAVGCDGSPSFGLEIIRQNKAEGRLIVADLFGLTMGDECRREAKENDLFQAYATVIQAWTEFAFDWLADPVLPRLVESNGRLEWQRYLVGLVVINDWQFGDAVQVWRPDAGIVYGAGVGSQCSPRLAAVGIPELEETTSAYSIATPHRLTGKGLPGDTALVTTLVPYAMQPAKAAAWAKSFGLRPGAATSTGRLPFLPIDAAGLCSYDRSHLTYGSSLVATDRLLAALERWEAIDATQSPSPKSGSRLRKGNKLSKH